MKSTCSFISLVFVMICFLSSCQDDKVVSSVEYYSKDEYQVLKSKLDLPSTPYNYNRFQFGAGRSDALGTLGRVLFYDKNLSKDNSVSCGACHQQNLGFADNESFSKGIENRVTARNTLSLGAFSSFGDYSSDPQTTLFWDGRVKSLHDQMIQTIRNPKEMGLEMSDVVSKIKDLDYYRILSEKAFFTPVLTESLVLEAIEGFMTSINSATSKFDIIRNQVNFDMSTPWSGFNNQENLGKSIFTSNCIGCHSQGLNNFVFGNDIIRSANNGLELVYADKGEGANDPAPSKLAIFKVPGLRNIALTGPYMHDGRFATLEDVINFYSTGIQDHPNLNPLLKTEGHAKKFNFTSGEKDALIQFLNTLTDNTMVNDVKWSDPFL